VKPHLFHPEADEEYVQAVQYYADIAIELGWRFHDEMERLIREACGVRVIGAGGWPDFNFDGTGSSSTIFRMTVC